MGIFCLFLISKGKLSTFPNKYDICYRMLIIKLGKFSSIPNLLRYFLNYVWMINKYFCCTYYNDHRIFLLYYQMLNHPYIPDMNSPGS